MSDETPDKAEPPYPGWSAQQPPERPGPGEQPPGRQSPGTSGWQTPGTPGSGAADAPTAGAGTPSAGAPPSQGWGPSQWGWATPRVKPGVIPLRPLGVGEILDGAVTTIRRNLGAMLGLSVAVAVIIQLGGLYFNRTIFDSLNEMASLPVTASDDVVFGLVGDLIAATLVYAAIDWLGRTLLTGVLTVVVSRAVLGEKMSAGEAWRRARPRLLRLIGLTIVYSLIAAGPVLAATLLATLLAFAGGGTGAVALSVVLVLAALPITIWLAIRYLLAPPIIMIETVQRPNGRPVPIGIVGSLRRSADLVRTSWWRVFGIYLLIVLIAQIVASAMSYAVSLPAALADPTAGIGFGALLLLALGGVLATAATAPFVAAAIALLYVDRRIRAEGLDIELARAAGVTIPGRPDPPGPQG